MIKNTEFQSRNSTTGVTKGGRLDMVFARGNVGCCSAPLMVAHIDVDQEGEVAHAHAHAALHLHPHPHPPAAGAVIVSGIEINTGGGAEVAAPTDKQQVQAKRGLGKVSSRSSWRRVLATVLPFP